MTIMAFVHTGEFDDGYLFFDIYKSSIKRLDSIENIKSKEIRRYCDDKNPDYSPCEYIGWAMRDKKDENKIKLYYRKIGSKALFGLTLEEKREE